MKQNNKFKYILVELADHLPYSIFGVAIGLVVMGVLTFAAVLMQSRHALPGASRELFHVFHAVHVLFSAVATTAMFLKHEQRIVKAVFVGLAGSVILCGLSDIFFPFWGGLLLGKTMHMHICFIEEPGLVFPFAVVGVAAGLLITKTFEHSTEHSHTAHVFVSSAASILYLIGFGLSDWIPLAGGVFIVTIVAVMIPCCASDIIFPICCSHTNCDHD